MLACKLLTVSVRISLCLADLAPSIDRPLALDRLEEDHRWFVCVESVYRVRRQEGHVAASGNHATHSRARRLVTQLHGTLG